jgi:tRNA A-37 threonylcarbamoyl transferase component Bud32
MLKRKLRKGRHNWQASDLVRVATMANPSDLMLADLTSRYAGDPPSPAFTRLYTDDKQFGHVFAGLHERLNQHFSAINGRARSKKHYWAENSRGMLALIDELDDVLAALKAGGFEVTFADGYREAVDRCRPWLAETNGSAIPDDFSPIHLVKYEAVFMRPESAVRLRNRQQQAQLKMVGQGSYANVYSFTDPDYGIKFAIKRAKKDLDERALHRFKEEFDTLKRLRFPYIVEVYQYNDARNEYMMEFCDDTLRKYIARRNSELSFAARKRIALQFLYGINYIHYKDLLHRDVSLQNVLLKVFDDAVVVKLSDFGLVKDRASEFTQTSTDMKGTIRDPALGSFKDYGVVNEIFAVGWVLSYIFTGKESLTTAQDEVGQIIRKCTAHDPDQRYQRIKDLIADVDRLKVWQYGTPA